MKCFKSEQDEGQVFRVFMDSTEILILGKVFIVFWSAQMHSVISGLHSALHTDPAHGKCLQFSGPHTEPKYGKTFQSFPACSPILNMGKIFFVFRSAHRS